MVVLSIFLSLFTSQNLLEDSVSINFTFNRMWPGKPTLKYYYYDVSLNNYTNETKYLVIPRWFEKELLPTDKVWGAQFDSFGDNNGSTLFSSTTFTVFVLPPKKKLILKDFSIETFSEEIEKKNAMNIPIIICSKVTVGEMSLDDFMKNKKLHYNNLKYEFTNMALKTILINIK